jgi:hypothetical protein
MSYIYQFITTYWVAVFFIQIAFAAFVVWGILHEEEFVQFEDKIISFVVKLYRRKKFGAKRSIYKTARKVFLFFYIPYRRMKKKVLKRLLEQFGLCAVRTKPKQVTDDEILSW